MTKKIAEDTNMRLSRENPPVMPMGFRFGVLSESVCVVDLIDTNFDGVSRAFYSFVITKDHAKDLVKSLNQFIERKH